MSRKPERKKNPRINRSNSAVLVPEEAGLPARGGDPIGRPAWVPGDVDLFKVPEPAYRQMVGAVEDPLDGPLALPWST